MRVYVAVIGLWASLIGCERVASDRAQRTSLTDQSSNGQPIITFLVRDLDDQDATGPRPESVWAQNDNIDSIIIAITGLPNMLLREVTIDLLGGPATEGDATLVDKARRKVRWQRLTDVNPDSLRETLGGKQLLRIQPSVLWDAFRSLTGGRFSLDSLHVSVETTNGKKTESGLAMLWD